MFGESIFSVQPDILSPNRIAQEAVIAHPDDPLKVYLAIRGAVGLTHPYEAFNFTCGEEIKDDSVIKLITDIISVESIGPVTVGSIFRNFKYKTGLADLYFGYKKETKTFLLMCVLKSPDEKYWVVDCSGSKDLNIGIYLDELNSGTRILT